MVSNPVRFDSRYNLYRQFAAHMADSGVTLWTCEIQQQDRAFQVTDADNPRHLQLRTDQELWFKENALGVLSQHAFRTDPTIKYVAWVDADVFFPDWVQHRDHNWATETIEQLQVYGLVQMFVNAIDLGPDGGVLQVHTGFGYQYAIGKPYPPKATGYEFWHPGYCWAMRRDTWSAVGNAYGSGIAASSFAILGSGDHHFSLAAIGKVDASMPGNISPAYRNAAFALQNTLEKNLRRSVGFVPGTILHYYHGSKASRQYQSRWDIISKNGFDPAWDLSRDENGLWQLVDHGDLRSVTLRQQIQQYFRARNEDHRP